MSFNIPFIAVNKLLNVEDYITGKIATKGNRASADEDEDDDEDLPPILSPQPVPGLLLDHSKVEASRTRIENVWNTKKDFPTAESRKLCCLYCDMNIVSRERKIRWFLPTRREKKMASEDEPLDTTVSYVYFGEGVFCTYYCTFIYAYTKKIRAESAAAYLKLLKLMYHDFYGCIPPVIDTQTVKDHLEKHGGFLPEAEFRKNALKYEPK